MFFVFIFSFAFSREIKDGETRSGTLSYMESNKEVFSYSSKSTSDLLIMVSMFSDNSDPFLYIHSVPEVSENNFLYSSTSRNEALMRIPSSLLSISNSSNYYILLKCQNFCNYRLSIFQDNAILLQDGIPISNTLSPGDSLLFKYEFTKDSKETLASLQYSGEVSMFVSQESSDPSPENSLEVKTNWLDDYEFFSNSFKKNDEVYIKVVASKPSHFLLVLTDSPDSPVKVQESKVIKGTINHSQTKNYFIELTENASGLEISLTVFRGDADIYISFMRQPGPNFHDFSSESIGNDFIRLTKKDFEKLNFLSGRVFLSVYGAEDSSFSFVVRLSQISSVGLSEGVPLESNILDSEIQNYFFPLAMYSQNISIYLTTYDGDADLYVQFCAHRCIITSEIKNSEQIFINEGSQALQSIDLVYQPETFCVFSSCNFAVAVKGKSQSYYSLVVTTENSKIVLQQGRSFIMSFPATGEKGYEYSVTDLTVTQVDFVLTPVFGNPDICVSFNTGDQKICEKKSSKNGFEVDVASFVRGDDRESLAGVFDVRVSCVGGCYYSIVVRETAPEKNSSVHLIPGHPQKDILVNSTDQDYRIYYFDVGESKNDIKIVLTSHIGKFDVFVANSDKNLDWKHEKFYYNWKASESGNNDHLTISHSDKHYKENSKYLILVQAVRFSGDNSASYTIQFTQGDDIFMLLSDMSMSGHIESQEYAFYSFPLHYSRLDIKISLTVSSGDPDLYISLDYQNTRPSKSSYSIRSTTFGSETLTLLWDDEISTYCPELAQEYKHGMSHGCFLYISVYSEYASSYTLRVSPQSNLPKYLSRGGITYGNLNRGEYEFFYGFVEVNEKLIVSLQNIVGDSELLVSVNDKDLVSSDLKDWVRPSEDNSMIKVKNLLTEEVKMTPAELASHCESTCLVLASVKCISDTCSFVIEIPEEEIVKLTEGQAKFGYVGRDFQYYSYFCDKAEADLVFIVTPLEGCDPSLYISKGKDSRPSLLEFDWFSVSSSGESVKITAKDKYFQGKSMQGTYIIGVTSEHDTCSYTITVTNHEIPVVVLSAGLPQQGSLLANEYKYYALYNSLSEQVSIALTPSLGSPYLLVSVHSQSENEFLADLPSQFSYQWNTNHGKDKYSLTITSEDPLFCRDCYYLIAVTSEEIATFTITASTETSWKVLQNGFPYKREIKQANFHYFSFTSNGNLPLHISVSEYSGQVDFGVSSSKGSADFTWKASSGFKTKSLLIPREDPNFSAGTYFITVSTTDPIAVYSIVCYHEETYISLVDGWPLVYRMAGSSESSVKFKFDQSGSIFCMLESLKPGFLPSVVSSKRSKVTKEVTVISTFSPDNYQDRHILMDFQLDLNETLMLNMKNLVNQSDLWNEFSLYCTKSFHPAMLAVGLMSIGHLNKGRPALRYEVSSVKKQTFSIYVVPCMGNVQLQVSTNWTMITGEPTLLTLIKLTDGVIFGKVKDFEGQLYLTVSNKDEEEPASFKVLVDNLQLPRLFPGNEGFLSWDFEKDKVKVEWNGLEYSDGKPYEGKVTYHLFFTRSQSVPLLTTCQVQYAASRKEGKWLGSTEKTSILVDLKKDGYLTIVAQVEALGVVALNEVIYDKTKIEGSGLLSSSLRLIFILSITAIVLGIMVWVFYCRYRKVKTEVKVMKDYGKQLEIVDDTIMHENPK